LLRRLVEQLLDHKSRQLDAVGEIEDSFAALDTHELQQQTEQVAPRDTGRGESVRRGWSAMDHGRKLLLSQIPKGDQVCTQSPAACLLALQCLRDRGVGYKLSF
jgi:hypothetical protein